MTRRMSMLFLAGLMFLFYAQVTVGWVCLVWARLWWFEGVPFWRALWAGVRAWSVSLPVRHPSSPLEIWSPSSSLVGSVHTSPLSSAVPPSPELDHFREELASGNGDQA